MLRFELKTHPRNGSPAIYLNRFLNTVTDKVTHVDDHARYDEDQATQEDLLCYVATSTYKYISSGDHEEAAQVLSYVHDMFDMCTPEEEHILSLMYINMHLYILQEFSKHDGTDPATRIPGIINWLSQYLAMTDDKVDFVGKFRDVARRMDITVSETIGKRVHDTPEMTFTRDYIVEVMVISFVSKMLTPIFALAIDMINNYVDSKVREIHVAGILRDLLYKEFYDIGLKLKNYIENAIKFSCGKQIKYAINAQTDMLSTEYTFAHVLVRKLVTINTHRPDSNIMVYIHHCSHSTGSNSAGSGSEDRMNVEVLDRPPGAQAGEEGNTSVLELDADLRHSARTADVPELVAMAIDGVVTAYLHERQISRELFEEAKTFYMSDPAPVSDCARYLLAAFVGNKIGGAAGLNIIEYRILIDLVIILQFELAFCGFSELAHVVTMRPVTSEQKVVNTVADNMIQNTWSHTATYANITDKLPYEVNGLCWHQMMGTIVNQITGNYHIRKTAPAICRYMGEPEVYSDIRFEYSDQVAQKICTFINMQIE